LLITLGWQESSVVRVFGYNLEEWWIREWAFVVLSIFKFKALALF
jgi:hypothetical protein